MYNKIKLFTAGVFIGAILVFFFKKPIIKEVKVPFKVKIPIPVIKKRFDTIYLPTPEKPSKKEVDIDMLRRYKKLNDSLKEELFKSAVTKREYKEVFEDSIQTITVSMNVTGELNSIFTKYITKPRAITLDTILKIKIPDYSRHISLYSEIGIALKNPLEKSPLLKAGFDISNKNKWVWGASVDTEKRVWLKLGKKWNF